MRDDIISLFEKEIFPYKDTAFKRNEEESEEESKEERIKKLSNTLKKNQRR